MNNNRLLDIQNVVRMMLMNHFGLGTDLSKYDATVIDAAEAIAKIEEIANEQTQRVLEATKSVCETQNIIEQSIRENARQEDIENYLKNASGSEVIEKLRETVRRKYEADRQDKETVPSQDSRPPTDLHRG